MKLINFCILVALLGISTVAAADNSAESHSTTTDANGTTVTSDSTKKDSTGWTGSKKSEVDEEKVTDPKGMMNKTTESLHKERQVKPNGDQYEESNRVDAAGTSHDVTTSKTTSKNWGGGETTTSKKSITVDPKGLGNKETGELTEEVQHNPDGSVKRSVTKKINGNTVSESTESHQ